MAFSSRGPTQDGRVKPEVVAPGTDNTEVILHNRHGASANDIIKTYDKVAVLKAGKIVEMGAYDELIARKGVLYGLVVGK